MTCAAYARPAPKRDQQGDVAALGVALDDHPVEGERDRRGRRVALVDDVARDADVLGELHRAGHGVGDAVVGLVRHEHVQVVDGDAGRVEGCLGDLGHLERRPAEDLVALHHQVRHERLVRGNHVAPVLRLADQVELLAV